MAFQSIFSGSGPYVYIVAPNGNFPTIQSAIDQANTDGYSALGTTISIAAGTYNESLTLIENINLVGSSGEEEVQIVGVHTPPIAGTFIASNIIFTSLTSILSSAAAGACDIKFYDCIFNCANGYALDVAAWTGLIVIESCDEVPAGSNGIVFNNGSAKVNITSSSIGSGAVGARFSGQTNIYNSRISCDLLFVGNATANIQDSTVAGAVTIDDPATAYIYNSYLTNATTALFDNSTIDVYLGNVVIDVAGGDAISGTGTRMNIAEVAFINQTGIAGTLTVLVTETYCAASNLRSYGRVELPETNAAATEGLIYFGADPIVNAMGTDNIFLGASAGNLALTVANATDNVAVGSGALNSVTTGAHNVALGSAAGTNVTTGSNCILIDNPGIAAENQTIRIGTAQTANYQFGIYQASSGATKEVVFVDSNQKLSSSSLGFTQWTTATASLTAAINTGYVVVMAIPGLCSIQIPAVSTVGDIIEITGLTIGMWRLTQQAGQTVHFSGVDTTPGVGGSISATTRYDSIKIICVVASAEWNVLSSTGVFNIV